MQPLVHPLHRFERFVTDRARVGRESLCGGHRRQRLPEKQVNPLRANRDAFSQGGEPTVGISGANGPDIEDGRPAAELLQIDRPPVKRGELQIEPVAQQRMALDDVLRL